MAKQEDLSKVTLITVLGLVILIGSLFWLKGYKYHNQKKIKIYFSDVGGLENGSIVRWSGLRVGVVEEIKPIFINEKLKVNKKNNKFLGLYEKDLEEIKALEEKLIKEKNEKEKNNLLEKINELKNISSVHKKQEEAYNESLDKIKQSHVEVTLVITKKDIPLGPLSRISIVPSGLIGDNFVEITPIIEKEKLSTHFDTVFITKEPLRFERLLKANIESSEAFRDAIVKVNQLIKDEDIELLKTTISDARLVVANVNKLVENAGVLLTTTSQKIDELANSSNQLSASVIQVGENINQIIGDEELREDIKITANSLNAITSEIADLLDEKGLAKDVLEISKIAKETSTEVSSFVHDLRKTHEELELPKTISNLNSLAEKLDKLTTELELVLNDDEVKDDFKTTLQKARETSENLEKISDKLNKRFLLFRLLF